MVLSQRCIIEVYNTDMSRSEPDHGHVVPLTKINVSRGLGEARILNLLYRFQRLRVINHPVLNKPISPIAVRQCIFNWPRTILPSLIVSSEWSPSC